MPPKRVVYVQPGGSRRQPKGYFASTYDTLTSAENSAVVKAIASFTVRYLPTPRSSVAVAPTSRQTVANQ